MRRLSKVLCLLVCVFLLAACGKQAAEDPTEPTAKAVQEENADGVEEGQLPATTVPQQTEQVTAPAEDTEPPKETEPTEPAPTEPPQETEPTEPEPTEPAPTEPPKETAPTDPVPTEPPETDTEPTEPPGLDENELPPIPVF